MKLHGIKKMNKQISKVFCQATGVYIPMFFNTDFYYLPDSHKIEYTLLISEKADFNFTQFFKKQFNLIINNNIELFCMSVLHEIGHYMTYDNIGDDDYFLSKQEQEIINQQIEENPDNNDIYSQYFYLPIEILANTWAADFVLNNPIKFHILVTEVSNILKKFYKKNLDITEENVV